MTGNLYPLDPQNPGVTRVTGDRKALKALKSSKSIKSPRMGGTPAFGRPCGHIHVASDRAHRAASSGKHPLTTPKPPSPLLGELGGLAMSSHFAPAARAGRQHLGASRPEPEAGQCPAPSSGTARREQLCSQWQRLRRRSALQGARAAPEGREVVRDSVPAASPLEAFAGRPGRG